MPYTHTGKQMFLNGRHVADAASDAMAGVLCENLNRDREACCAEVDGDLAVAISEHAFRAGYKAGRKVAADLAGMGFEVSAAPDDFEVGEHIAWSDYTPPDELCGVSLVVTKP